MLKCNEDILSMVRTKQHISLIKMKVRMSYILFAIFFFKQVQALQEEKKKKAGRMSADMLRYPVFYCRVQYHIQLCNSFI